MGGNQSREGPWSIGIMMAIWAIARRVEAELLQQLVDDVVTRDHCSLFNATMTWAVDAIRYPIVYDTQQAHFSTVVFVFNNSFKAVKACI